MILDGFDWALIAASLATSLAYGLVFARQEPSPVRSILKTIPVAALAVLALTNGAPPLLVAALALGALGDLLLALGSDKTFLAGLVAFLTSHLLYVVVFIPLAVPPTTTSTIIGFGMVVAASMIARQLWPGLGSMRVPVMAYFVVILAMGATAWALPEALWLATLGATLFILSDAILSFEMFKLRPDAKARAWTPYAVWFLYYGAQACLAAAFLLRVPTTYSI
jgi:uncharacterized membrane protein YhhN